MLFFRKKKERPHKPVCPEPLTLPELDSQIKNRIDTIQQEFIDGFNLIQTFPKSVTFFGSARTLTSEQDYQNASKLAGEISKLGYTIITGGGSGIMAAANQGAHEAKGVSVGLTIQLPFEQVTNLYTTSVLDFKYFFTRKVALTYSAEAYVYFPGGFGTLDELFEILTLVQTKKIERVPIILFGSYYWKPLIKFIKRKLLVHQKIDAIDMNLFYLTDSIEDAVAIIKAAPVREAH